MPRDPRSSALKMFGGIVGMVNGNMYGGLFARSVMHRLNDFDAANVKARRGDGCPKRCCLNQQLLGDGFRYDGLLLAGAERTRCRPLRRRKNFTFTRLLCGVFAVAGLYTPSAEASSRRKCTGDATAIHRSAIPNTADYVASVSDESRNESERVFRVTGLNCEGHSCGPREGDLLFVQSKNSPLDIAAGRFPVVFGGATTNLLGIEPGDSARFKFECHDSVGAHGIVGGASFDFERYSSTGDPIVAKGTVQERAAAPPKASEPAVSEAPKDAKVREVSKRAGDEGWPTTWIALGACLCLAMLIGANWYFHRSRTR